MSRVFGLQRVWPRDDGAVGDRIVDIIAIHGLGTQSPRTWLAYEKLDGGSQQRSVNWLADEDMLPARFPNSCIWTYDWDGDYHVNASVDRLLGQAEVFLRAIKSKILRRDGARPFIIIASCFGGLIASKAVQAAVEHQAEFRGVLMSLAGIVFLASPLKGTRMKKALDWHILISTLMGKQVSDTLYKDLDARTDVLQDLAHYLTSCANGNWETWYRFPIFCFFETKKTQVFKAILGNWINKVHLGKRVLVSREDATLDGIGRQGLVATHAMMSKFRGPNDPNFEAVTVRLGQFIESAPDLLSERSSRAKFNVFSTLPWAVNPLFAGREEAVNNIVRAFRTEQPAAGQRKVFVITGEGGLGKSELSLQVAHRMQDEIWGTFWVDGSSRTAAEAGYLVAVDEIGKAARSMDEALRRLSMVKEQWLLILDNADDITANYHAFLPPGQNGFVIITSRNPDCHRHQTIGFQQLTGLDDPSASELLLNAAGVHEAKWESQMVHAKAVTQLLCGHPLALLQAGAYIERFCSVAEYPSIFRSRPQQQMGFGVVQGQSRFAHVQGTFDVSVDALERIGDQTAQDSKDLLTLLSMLHFSSLPLDVFKSASAGTLITGAETEFLGGITPAMLAATPKIFRSEDGLWGNNDLQTAISTLRSLALISVGTWHGLKTLSMHPLVHKWAQSRFAGNDTGDIDPRWLTAGTFLSLVSRGSDRWDWWMMDLRSHLRAFINKTPPDGHCKESPLATASILYQCARLLHHERDYRLVGVVLDRVFAILGVDEQDPVLGLLPLYDLKASSEEASDRHVVAKAHCRRCEYFTSRYAFAIDSLTGNLETVKTELGDVILKRKAKFDERDPVLVDAQQELARVLLLLDVEFDRAITLFEQVVKARDATLRLHDPIRLNTRLELARAYLKSSRRSGHRLHREKAIEILKGVISQEEAILAEDDRQRLSTLHGLAKAYLDDDQIVDARKLLLDAFTLQSGTLHVEDAMRVLRDAVRHQELRSSKPHLGPLPAYQSGLASSLLGHGDTEAARELAKIVYQERQRILPVGHQDIRASEELMAKIEATKKKSSGVTAGPI
ncbi:hypothetical protein GGR56DRAFT_630397 [Xylariaceae sp. FL0804]|nr:hypothetical protein GGR56DRAFT_630397 [Xylariaceae sp. FL0804]